MDGSCFGPTCTGLKNQAMADANKCTVAKVVNENEEGCELFQHASVSFTRSDKHIGITSLPGEGGKP